MQICLRARFCQFPNIPHVYLHAVLALPRSKRTKSFRAPLRVCCNKVNSPMPIAYFNLYTNRVLCSHSKAIPSGIGCQRLRSSTHRIGKSEKHHMQACQILRARTGSNGPPPHYISLSYMCDFVTYSRNAVIVIALEP